MTELLIIKSGSEYLRFTADGFQRCRLNKASVFPLAQAAEAKDRCREAVAAGEAAQLIKLQITEEPYEE
ncbi:MAG: hypothetical protein OEL83_15970 [Desulforhopalus sp.]|nr:hypothetical protein [Desulforhopalus sp.]